MYRKICVAVDGSPSSHEAVKAAAVLASQFDAALVLLHVIRPMKIPQELQKYIQEDDLAKIRYSALENVGQEIIARAMEIAQGYAVTKLSSQILSGDPAAQIIEQTRNQAVDLIVLGTRGLGRLEGALIGSISRKIAERSDTNLLIIKQPISG
jgi:nucleotide-binding universal stress UspA family protein